VLLLTPGFFDPELSVFFFFLCPSPSPSLADRTFDDIPLEAHEKNSSLPFSQMDRFFHVRVAALLSFPKVPTKAEPLKHSFVFFDAYVRPPHRVARGMLRFFPDWGMVPSPFFRQPPFPLFCSLDFPAFPDNTSPPTQPYCTQSGVCIGQNLFIPELRLIPG